LEHFSSSAAGSQIIGIISGTRPRGTRSIAQQCSFLSISAWRQMPYGSAIFGRLFHFSAGNIMYRDLLRRAEPVLAKVAANKDMSEEAARIFRFAAASRRSVA
jgi:hypothetical protein